MDLFIELKDKSYENISLVFSSYKMIEFEYKRTVEVMNVIKNEMDDALTIEVPIDQKELFEERKDKLIKDKEKIDEEVFKLNKIKNDLHFYLVSIIDSYCHMFKETSISTMERLINRE